MRKKRHAVEISEEAYLKLTAKAEANAKKTGYKKDFASLAILECIGYQELTDFRRYESRTKVREHEMTLASYNKAMKRHYPKMHIKNHPERKLMSGAGKGNIKKYDFYSREITRSDEFMPTYDVTFEYFERRLKTSTKNRKVLTMQVSTAAFNLFAKYPDVEGIERVKRDILIVRSAWKSNRVKTMASMPSLGGSLADLMDFDSHKHSFNVLEIRKISGTKEGESVPMGGLIMLEYPALNADSIANL